MKQRSTLSGYLVLGLSLFAICYLVAHVAAALFGWRVVVYGGATLGVWLFLGFLVACWIAAARHD